MKVHVLLNAAAGSAGANSRKGEIEEAFRKRGVDATVEVRAGPEISTAAGRFVKSHAGFDALVVAGGDGTIGAAAAELAGTNVPLGILPLGTLNHFAKDLGLPIDLDQAAEIIASGQVRRVDVGQLNGRVFVNNSSVGLYPFMVTRRNADQRRGRSKLAATLPAVLRTLRATSWRSLIISAAGNRKRVRTPCMFVGNNPYELELKAFGTRKCLDRGELCIHVVRQQTRLGILLLPFKIAFNLVDPVRDVETFTSAEVEITSRKRHFRVSLDGEVAVMRAPLRYSSRPGALTVFAKTPSDTTTP